MIKKHFNITGMSCSACSAHVNKAVSELKGIKSVSVNLLKNSMTVNYDETLLNDSQIISAVIEAGYGATLKNSESNQTSIQQKQISEYKHLKNRLFLSLIFSVPLSYIAMSGMFNLPIPNAFKGNENALIFVFTQFLLVLPPEF